VMLVLDLLLFHNIWRFVHLEKVLHHILSFVLQPKQLYFFGRRFCKSSVLDCAVPWQTFVIVLNADTTNCLSQFTAAATALYVLSCCCRI
jgi:hypothetical protein